ncbi:MAG TPA: helix-turn-helix domain-containing protein [Polyangiaceae bacterium]|nr:helix-turn-helix domain-containing protein [Polyangiaceae bacterium]
MPRRREPDPLALAVGQRIRQLRESIGLTMEGLAFESELGSKGHLSNIERGLVMPTVATLKVLAERLGVLPLDLVTFPEDDDRQRLVDATRSLPKGTIRKLLKDCATPTKPRTRKRAVSPAI